MNLRAIMCAAFMFRTGHSNPLSKTIKRIVYFSASPVVNFKKKFKVRDKVRVAPDW